MKREEIIKEFSNFISQRTIKRIEYEKILEEMTEKNHEEAVQEELFSWGSKELPRLRKLFISRSPKKILKEKKAVKKVIYVILKEFVDLKVQPEGAKFKIMMKYSRSENN